MPPLVAHTFIALSDDPGVVMGAAQKRLSFYPRLPFYARMFTAAGYPEAERGDWSEAMLRAVVIYGDESTVSAGLQAFMDVSGASEVIASLLPVSPDTQSEMEHAMRLIAGL